MDFYNGSCKHSGYWSKNSSRTEKWDRYRIRLWWDQRQWSWQLGSRILPRKPCHRTLLHHWTSTCCTFFMHSTAPCNWLNCIDQLGQGTRQHVGKKKKVEAIPGASTKCFVAYWWPSQAYSMGYCYPWGSWWILTQGLYHGALIDISVQSFMSD